MNIIFELLLITILVSLTNSFIGNYLILRKSALLSFALSHASLFGIALVFLFIKDLDSPFLVVGAGLTGVLIVAGVQYFSKVKNVKEDSALGLLYLTFFALGIILISQFASQTTLSIDSAITGHLLFTVFQRFEIFGIDIGPRIIWVMLGLLFLNISFITILNKELKLTIFDPDLARVLGYNPTLLSYLLLTMASITIVGSYEAVGIILVVSFMIVPPATAYLLTSSVNEMIYVSSMIAISGSVLGFFFGWFMNISIPGSIAVTLGIIFLITIIFAPNKGVLHNLKTREGHVTPPPVAEYVPDPCLNC